MLSTTSNVYRRCFQKMPALGAAVARLKHTLPDLKYDFNALEPYISADIMKLHYEKHHNAYVNNLNVAEEKLSEAIQKGITLVYDICSELVQSSIKIYFRLNVGNLSAIIGLQPALKFNGGGHINHAIFWQNLSPKGGGEPEGDLLQQIKDDFSTFDRFKSELVAATVAIQGSGWGWLGYNPVSGRLRVATCANQDPLQATTGLIPLFGIDVWEHAYYLQYKNVRPDYVNAIFNVANWKDVSERLAKARLT